MLNKILKLINRLQIQPTTKVSRQMKTDSRYKPPVMSGGVMITNPDALHKLNRQRRHTRGK